MEYFILIFILLGIFLLGAVTGWATHRGETKETIDRYRANRDHLAMEMRISSRLARELAAEREEIVDIETNPDYHASVDEWKAGRYGCPIYPTSPGDKRIKHIRKPASGGVDQLRDQGNP